MKPTAPQTPVRLALAALAACATLQISARAEAQPAVDAAIIAGVDQDTTAIARLYAGGFWAFGKIAPEVHVGFDGFLRIDTSQGIAARSFNLIDVGVRYGFKSDHFVGPYVSTGANFGLFTGKPHERKVTDDEELCSTADIPDGQPTDECVFRIDKNASFRLGFGWGFASSSKTTVGVRIDLNYWLFSVSDYDDQSPGAPIPREIARPQDSWALMVGLEFMRWR